MKKNLILILLFLCTTSFLFADYVYIEKAEKIAINWYKHYNNGKSYEIEKTIEKDYNNHKSYYIFTFMNGGFVIVSANDVTIPILGYSSISDIQEDITNPAVKEWMKSYEDQIDSAISQEIDNSRTLNLWHSILINDFSSFNTGRDVSPLLSTTWNQGQYYNELCPVDGNSSTGNGHVWAGCVATAMAQIMKYWNHPIQGIGSHSYNHSVYGTQSANFGATTYNWANMPNNVTSSNTDVQTLLYHCGVSVDMNYGPNGSGAYSSDVDNALIDYFNYVSSLSYETKSNYSNSAWINLLKNELDNGRPMYYSGHGSGGHAFVCDGYQGNDYFHFNWGWSGSYNGYFYLNDLTPGSHNYNNSQAAVVGIEPIGGGSVPDISITDIWYEDVEPIVQGETFDFHVNFENIGDGIANNIDIIYEGYYNGSWIEIGSDTHSSLTPGESREEHEDCIWDYSSGNIQFRARIPAVSGETNTGNNVLIETWFVDVQAYLSVTPSNQNVDCNSGNTSFNISSNISWSVSDDADWLTISPINGSNNEALTATYEENPSVNTRIATITITGSNLTETVTVTQTGNVPYLSITPSNQNVGCNSGNTSFNISSNISWSVSDDADWLTVYPINGSNDETLSTTYEENTTIDTRIATITVTGSYLTETVTVTQAGTNPHLSVTPSNQDVGFNSGYTSFNISSNINWAVSDDADWLTISPINGSNDETLVATYEENGTIDTRIATITVNGNGLTEIVTVTQSGANPYLTVTPSNQDVDFNSGNTSFNISSNINWNVSDNSDWLIVSPTNGSNDGTILASYEENPTIDTRIATITVNGNGLIVTVTVTQAGATPYLSVSPSNQNVGYGSGNSIFYVSSNISWSVSDNASWLLVTPTGGSNNGILTTTYEENTTVDIRIATITVTGNGLTEIVTVTQAGADPYLSVTPSNQNVGYGSGNTSFNLCSNINWSLSDNANWLTISPINGSNDETLVATYEENGTIDTRIATITVTGNGLTEIVTVTQAGATPYLSVTPPNQDVGSDAGNTTFNISSNISWSVTDNADWLTVSPANGSNDEIITADYEENTTIESRTATITVTGNGIDETVTVTQAGATPYLSVTPPNQDVGSDAGNTTFNISSNISWTVTDNAGWLTVSSANGSNDEIITADYEENTSIVSRTATITVNGNGLTEIVTVTQEAGTSINDDVVIPNTTKLVGNFPNPFNPTTTIQYDLNKSGFVQIEIYNVKGQKIKSLVNQNQTAGNKSVIWYGVNNNGNRIGSGLFLYKLIFNGKVLSMKKCIMLK